MTTEARPLYGNDMRPDKFKALIAVRLNAL
jgi:hypothetical protein